MKKLLIVFIIFLLSCKETKRIDGIILMTGAEPFTELVVQNDSMSYYLPKMYKKKWGLYQQKQVTIYGTVSENELITADRKHKIKKYYLEPDSIIVHEN
jgi:hypothetical protein